MDAMPATTAELRATPYPGPLSRMRESADITEIASALVSAQAALANPPRNRSVTVTAENGRTYAFCYATLDKIAEMARHALAEKKVCVLQPIVATERGPAILTRLLHESGQWMECEVAMPATGRDPQAFGSAVTYLRRYALSALLNIAPDEDDDANSAAGNHVQDTSQQPGEHGQASIPTDNSEGTGDPVQALVERARAACTVADGKALLDAWQRQAAALEQHRGTAAWQAMERELGKGLQHSLGPILATAFTTALRADDAQHIAALRQKWDGEWAKTLRTVEQQAPDLHAALARHVTDQAARVRRLARSTLPRTQPTSPKTQPGDEAGQAGGDADQPEPDPGQPGH